MYSKDWHSKLAAGGVLLAGIFATTVFGADAPATGAAASPSKAPCDRHGDVDLTKMKEHAAAVFAKADTNGDGKITQAEFLAFKPERDGDGKDGHGKGMGPHMGMGMMGGGMGMHGHGPDGAPGNDAMADAFQAELFKELDTDHNGQLSSAEFSKAREAMQSDTMHTFMKTQMFTRLDKNSDGALTKDEFPPFAQKMSMMDTNGDGTVTRDEMHAQKKAMHAAKGTPGVQTGTPQN